MGRSTIPVIALVALAGCATQRLTARELAGRASASPIAAQDELAGRSVVVEGVVRGTTLTERDSMIGHVQTFGSFGTVTAEQHRETLALVVLEPGSVLCYFEPEEIGQAADLKEHQTVQLACRIDSFRPAASGTATEAVLSGCERKSP
jgi:hypothetical protein